MKFAKWFGIVLAILLILGLIVPLGIRFFGWYWGWAFNQKTESEVCDSKNTEAFVPEEEKSVYEDSIPKINEVCISDFVDAGASYAIAKDICTTEADYVNAYRLEAGEYCDSWGTIVYDADEDVEILKNFNAPTVASYSYCYPYSPGIQNAPFFTGAELNPFGEIFDIIFVEN